MMSKTKATLYDQNTIDQLDWSTVQDQRVTKSFILSLMKDGSKKYFSNVQTTMYALQVDDIVLPVTVNDKEYENSYVCSPYTHYVRYGLEHFKKEKRSLSSSMQKGGLSLFGALLRSCEIDRVVSVNNWLLPTNLYPSLTDDQLESIVDALVRHFPTHTVLFRSINEKQSPFLYNWFQRSSFGLIPSRPVYLVDTKNSDALRARMCKSDEKVFRNSYYTVHDPSKNDAARILFLYRMLNIEKYSELNPQYTQDFIELALKDGLLQFQALKNDQKIDGVFGYFERNGVITSPLFGYDLSQSKDLGLYRMISHLLLKHAHQNTYFLNQSSGAASYKKLRRAKCHIEYNAIYDRHLPSKRRIPWKLLDRLMNTIGVKQMLNQK